MVRGGGLRSSGAGQGPNALPAIGLDVGLNQFDDFGRRKDCQPAISEKRSAGAAAFATIALSQEKGWTQPGKAASKGQPVARSSG
jgi:hypothetical protein